MDTGPAVKGRIVDLYLWSCTEALQFGRRSVRLTVLRHGWSPENSIPGMVDTLFRKREAEARRKRDETKPMSWRLREAERRVTRKKTALEGLQAAAKRAGAACP